MMLAFSGISGASKFAVPPTATPARPKGPTPRPAREPELAAVSG